MSKTPRQPDSPHCEACGRQLPVRERPRGMPRRWCSYPCSQRGQTRERQGLPVRDDDYQEHLQANGNVRAFAASVKHERMRAEAEATQRRRRAIAAAAMKRRRTTR